MSSEPNQRRDGFLVICATLACFAVIAAVAAVGLGMRAIDSAENGTVATSAPVAVSLSEFAIGPAEIAVAEGGTLVVTNDGQVEHNLGIADTGPATPMLAAGESGELDVSSLPAGTYEVVCEVAGHASAGMTGTLTVSAAGAAAGETASADHGDMAMDMSSSSVDFEEMDRMMRERTIAFPAETEGVGGQILEPVVLEDGTKQFDLTVSQIPWEVEPGKVVEAMAYNGMVPGPTIQVDVGDRVRFVVTNEMDESTSVHWHGILLPNEMDGVPDITQDPIRPGETFTYEFTTREPAVGMYHSHHNAAHQVPDGLAGAFLVGEMPAPAGPAVSQEIPMMLNDAGTIGLTLNGKSFPATAPIQAEVGDRVMIHYLNEGLSVHPMHLHGMKQLVVAKDGYPLDQPYEADTINVAPGERYTVVVDVTEPGVWAYHCHILTHAESDQGMFGMVTALIAEA